MDNLKLLNNVKKIDDIELNMNKNTKDIKDISSQMDTIETEKMNKNTTDISVSQINKNLGKFDETYMTDDFLTKISGTSGINQTLALRSATTSKIASKSVTPNETSFFEEIVNIFNKDTITSGYALDRATGNTVVASSYFLSDYILIEPNIVYTVNKDYTDICAYDESKKFITGSGLVVNNNSDYTTPSNACYIRVASPGVQNASSLMVMKKINYTSTYYEYGKTNLKNKYVDLNYIGENVSLKDYSVLPTKTNFFNETKNLFNKDTVILGQGLNTSTGGLLNGDSYINNYVSDFIPLLKSGTLYSKEYVFICFYDKNKAFIQKGVEGANAINPIPENAKYCRIGSPSQSGIANQYLSYEKQNITYPYNTNTLKSELIDKPLLYGYKNKKWVSFGHSVVAQGKWQSYVSKYFDLIHTNCGVGGSTVSGTDGTTGKQPMWTDERINQIPVDTELITILCGLNDQKGTDNMGDINSTSTETFYGAFKKMIEKINSRCPNARIIILNDIYRNSEDWGIWKGEDYRKAIRELSYYYGLPILELKQMCGINKLTESVFLADGVHPNDVGGKRIGEVVIGFLKSIAPIN